MPCETYKLVDPNRFDQPIADAIARNPLGAEFDSLYQAVTTALLRAEQGVGLKEGRLIEVLTGRTIYEQAQTLAMEVLQGVQESKPCTVAGMICLIRARA